MKLLAELADGFVESLDDQQRASLYGATSGVFEAAAANAAAVQAHLVGLGAQAGEDEQYKRAKALCQLFLDTPSYNAHVTGTDALWVGIPLLTLPAEKVGSRIAAGLVATLGRLPRDELVVRCAPVVICAKRESAVWKSSSPVDRCSLAGQLRESQRCRGR
jgi:hypothetical protein